MIAKRFDKISLTDIELLIKNEVREGRTLEYKLDLPHEGESQKIPFLAEVSGFANTVGGDLLFGIEESAGIPTSIYGISSDNIDQEILRLENAIRTGIEPRIAEVALKTIKTLENKYLLIVRVKKSWNSPHRVTFKDHSKFYGRNSAGKYPLDVTELRNAFTLSQEIFSRIRQFRKDRVYSVFSYEELPVVLAQGGRIALHIFPLSAFMPEPLNIIPNLKDPSELRPFGAQGWNHKRNIDGVVTYSGNRGEPSNTYCQLYRSGIIETIAVLEPWEGGKLILPSEWYEKEILQFVQSYLGVSSRIGIDPPIYVFISLLGMKEYRLGVGYDTFSRGDSLNKEIAILPEAVIEEISEDPKKVLRPVFDMIWNAFGYERSLNYDENGNWNRQS